MKVAPLYHELTRRAWAQPQIIHTGQHYDPNMSDDFFADLGMPAPHVHLGVGSGSHAQQTGRVMMALEDHLVQEPAAMVVVVGDVNSTLAAALVASKLGIPLAHLEAGLRSFDRTMPEEINRLVTDQLADLLWTPSPDGDQNLLREGVAASRIARVGNIMIDSLEMLRPALERQDLRQEMGLEKQGYGMATLHRPANVDDPATLGTICSALIQAAARLPLVFAVHPRTRKNLERFGLWEDLQAAPGLRLTPPLSYLPFMSLVLDCALVVTDSGGLQEETTYLGIPCLTLRPNTERPVTVSQGTNQLCEPQGLGPLLGEILLGRWPQGSVPELWDGHTAARVADSMADFLGG